jgi:hypothetical protein
MQTLAKLSACVLSHVFAARVLRYGIKASGKSCAPLLPTLLETLPGRFQQVSRADNLEENNFALSIQMFTLQSTSSAQLSRSTSQ